MEHDIALIPYLEQIVTRTTQYYQNDFLIDCQRLRDAVSLSNMEDRIFYWMARPNGTWLVPEREAFFRDSGGYTIWTHYADAPTEIKACRVAVTGQKNGEVTGSVQPFNYAEQVKRIMRAAIPAVAVEVQFYSGEKIEVTPDYLRSHQEQIFWDYGAMSHIRYLPESEAQLVQLIAMEHRYQKGWKPKQKKAASHRREQGGSDGKKGKMPVL